MNIYTTLFFLFFKIGICTFGGGMAMLPILQRELSEKRNWVTLDELSDYYAIGQCTPGIIAVNTATFVGYRKAGALGGVCATLGVIAPSVVIITIIAAFLLNFSQYAAVGHFFGGVRACVTGLIFVSVFKLAKNALKTRQQITLFIAVLALIIAGRYLPNMPSVIATLSDPVVLVLLAGLCGLLLGKAKKGAD